MAVKKFTLKLSSIAKEIDRATKKLRAIRSKVSSRDRRRLDLDIKKLQHIARVLPCKRMTTTFSGSGS